MNIGDIIPIKLDRMRNLGKLQGVPHMGGDTSEQISRIEYAEKPTALLALTGYTRQEFIVKDIIRNWKAGFKDAVFETGCGLHNFRLNFRPWTSPPYNCICLSLSNRYNVYRACYASYLQLWLNDPSQQDKSPLATCHLLICSPTSPHPAPIPGSPGTSSPARQCPPGTIIAGANPRAVPPC